MQQQLAQAVKEQALALGFDLVGIASAQGSPRVQLRTAALQRWLAAGHQAEMAWMQDPRRLDLQQLLPGVQSVIAVGLNYATAGGGTTTA
jgi:epoxyqueuosine reductase